MQNNTITAVAPRDIWHAAKNAITKGEMDWAKELTQELMLIAQSNSPAAGIANKYIANLMPKLV